MSEQITTTLPGLVVRQLVTDGERVREGEGILVTETMKCEQTLLAPIDGTVTFSFTIADVVAPAQVVALVPPVRTRKRLANRRPDRRRRLIGWTQSFS